MQFYTTNELTPKLAKNSFSAGIAMVTPNGDAPLFAMSGLAQKVIALQTEHGYWSKQYDYPEVTNKAEVLAAVNKIALGAGAVINDPSLPIKRTPPIADREGLELPTRNTVKDADRLLVGQILRYIPAQAAGSAYKPPENMLVTAIDSTTNTITVDRGFDSTVAMTIPANAKLVLIGTAFEEGSNRPNSQAVLPARHMNLTQIFRNSWDVSGTLSATSLAYGLQPEANNRQDCGHFHARDIELATFFGRMSSSVKNNKPLHTMDGIEALIEKYAPNNLMGAGATTNYDQLQDMLNPLLNYKTSKSSQGNRRTIYTGGTGRHVLSEIGRKSGVYQIVDGQTNYGLSFSTFRTSRGIFDIVEHPLFNAIPSLSGMAVVADLSSFDFAYLQGRDTRHDMYNKLGGYTDGKDAYGGVLTTELTIELQNPFSWGIIYDLKKAA